MKLYDFGVKLRGKKPEGLKVIAFPVYAWTCYIPDNINPELNILEKLILSLVNKQVAKTKADLMNILVTQLKLNKALIENVIKECTIKYFNKSFKKELKLNLNAKNLLAAIENDITPDMKMSEVLKKIYLFQDAVTNTVLPIFNIETLPDDNESENIDDENCIILQKKQFEQPKTGAINNALRLWGRIFKAMNSGETVSENSIDLENEPFDLYNEENQINTLADKDEQPKTIETITIFDDEPKIYFAKGYLAFNPSNPTEIEIISPFGSEFDNCFMKLVNKLRISNKTFAEELEFFLMEKTEQFKDIIAFGNELDIQLFDDFPIICNDPKYVVLKKSIKELSKDVERIRKGEDESINFAKNMRTAIEVIFRVVIQENPDIAQMKKVYKEGNNFFKYKSDLQLFVKINNLNNDIIQQYCTRGIYKNIINQNQGNTKDNAALILLYANKYPSSPAMQFVKNYDYLFVEVFDLINLGNNASHAGSNYAQMYFSKKDAEIYYSKYENIVRALYTHLIKGDK